MTAYETITDELVEALDNYMELCEQPGVEFSIVGYAKHLLDSYEL